MPTIRSIIYLLKQAPVQARSTASSYTEKISNALSGTLSSPHIDLPVKFKLTKLDFNKQTIETTQWLDFATVSILDENNIKLEDATILMNLRGKDLQFIIKLEKPEEYYNINKNEEDAERRNIALEFLAEELYKITESTVLITSNDQIPPPTTFTDSLNDYFELSNFSIFRSGILSEDMINDLENKGSFFELTRKDDYIKFKTTDHPFCIVPYTSSKVGRKDIALIFQKSFSQYKPLQVS